MAIPKCTSCGGTAFENKDFTPKGSNYILTSVQCASCGGVVGVIPSVNTNVLIHELAKALKVRL